MCDKCQKYLGKEIENYVLSKTPFAFWKMIAGTKNKKGKMPFFDPTQSSEKRGRLDDFHPLTDSGLIFHPSDEESIIEVEVSDKSTLDKIISGEKKEFRLVLTPKMLIYIGRFLGKIALEYWCKEFGDKVFDAHFDELRSYVRYGTTNSIWTITLGKLNENLLIYKKVNEVEEIRTLYAYSLYEDVETGLILFNFDIGSERYSIIMNHKFPDTALFTEYFFSALSKGTIGIPQPLFYHL